MSSLDLKPGEAHAIAHDAYIYGYPLVLMDIIRQLATNVPRPDENRLKAPVNQFVHARAFPDYTFTDIVSPNADTLYSSAFLDLSREPIVLSVPDMGKRYYLMPMLDAWTNVFASPGTRTTGNERGDFAIVGPDWTGELPEGLDEIQAPTEMVWIIGRTQTNGTDDYAAVHAIQQQYRLIPLGAWGKSYTPPASVPVEPGVDTKTPSAEQVKKMSSGSFFSRLKQLLKGNPPAKGDSDALKRFGKIGFEPGQTSEATKLDSTTAKEVEGGVRDAQARIVSEGRKQHGDIVNGWKIMGNVGQYGADYLWRAVVATVQLGSNIAQDAIYARATLDSSRQPLTGLGANEYEIRFAPGQLPPVGGFWSVSLYNDKQCFCENPIGRHAIGDRDELKFNDDGSLSLYIQNRSPGRDKESNWLPAPNDSFNLMMRLYWPKKEVLEGAWKPPEVKRQAAELKRVA